MKNQVFIIGLALGLMLIAGCATQPGPILGGDKDEHGCIPSAGYSWCEAKQKCLRTWEENCSSDIATKAKEYCNQANVGSVNVCENYIEVNSELLGGGAKYYDLNGNAFNCPVVGSDSMTKQCKEIFEGKLAETFKCERVCPPEGCGECPQLVAPAPGWCEDGTIVAGEKNECGCQGPPKCLMACTEEAKICPDGVTAVGRNSENNCEFDPCPGETGGIGLPNPASVFCEEQGGTSKIITAQDGSQSGVCVLSYGIECDEWAYVRGECPEKHVCTAAEKAAEACTMEYMPVCGDDGMNYGNKCSACASKKIDSYKPGECLTK